jgi:hypothetical protein
MAGTAESDPPGGEMKAVVEGSAHMSWRRGVCAVMPREGRSFRGEVES